MGHKSLKSAILSPSNIASAWNSVKKNRVRWSANVSAKQLLKDPLMHTIDLIDQLRNETYYPAGFRRIKISKPSGGHRVISAYHNKDKMAQRLVAQVLQPILEAQWHYCSYGYRAKRNRFQAVEKANEYIRSDLTWVYDADIKQFFDSISHAKLKKKLNATIDCKWTRSLLNGWVDEAYYPAFSLLRKRGIPQGAVTSPMLCNLYLNDFDQALAKRAIPFVRYADDFLLFAQSKKQIQQVSQQSDKILNRLGLQINQQKTKITNASNGVHFLGLDLVR